MTSYDKNVNVAALIAAGVLQFDRMIEKDICCKYCGERNDVNWEEIRDVPTCMFHCCDPECRSNYVVDLETIKGWKVEERVILTALLEALDMKENVTEMLPDQVWKLGRRNRREYFFLRSVGHDNIRQIMAMFANQGKAVLVTTRQYGREILSQFMTNRCFSLEEVGTLDEKYRIIYDKELMESFIDDPPQTESRAKPKRSVRAGKIERLVTVLKDQVHAAHEYMEFTAAEGEIKLLPPLNQTELAKLGNMSQQDVSRCLNDSEAGVLRLLYNKSKTLDGIEMLYRMFPS